MSVRLGPWLPAYYSSSDGEAVEVTTGRRTQAPQNYCSEAVGKSQDAFEWCRRTLKDHPATRAVLPGGSGLAGPLTAREKQIRRERRGGGWEREEEVARLR